MNKYTEIILKTLVEKYRGSKKEMTGEGRTVSIKPSNICRDYESNYCDIAVVNEFNEAAGECEKTGFVTIDWGVKDNGQHPLKMKRILLKEDNIEQTERFLASEYGYISVPYLRDETQKTVDKYDQKSEAASYICGRLKEMLDKGKSPKDVKICKELLKTVIRIENNSEPLYPRELSMILFGDSKYLQKTKILKWSARVFLKIKDRKPKPGETEEDILEEYNILQRGEMLCIKGRGKISFNDTETDLGAFPHGLQFSSKDAGNIKNIYIADDTFMTIENYTSWLRTGSPGITAFYLGGYANNAQLRFLKQIYKDNPSLFYLHFGDTDPYGFYIHKDLCEKTGIPFKTYMMGESVLNDEKYADSLKPMTDADIKYAQSLAEISEYHDIAEYMLERKVKLEQEIISYSL